MFSSAVSESAATLPVPTTISPGAYGLRWGSTPWPPRAPCPPWEECRVIQRILTTSSLTSRPIPMVAPVSAPVVLVIQSASTLSILLRSRRFNRKRRPTAVERSRDSPVNKRKFSWFFLQERPSGDGRLPVPEGKRRPVPALPEIRPSDKLPKFPRPAEVI